MRKLSSQVNFNKYISQEQTINNISKFLIGFVHSKRNSLILSEYRNIGLASY